MQLKLSRTAQNLLFWGAAAAIFTLLLIPGIHVRKKHWDEPHWILSGQIGYQLLKHGDLDNPFWHRDNLFLLSNPWFSRLLVGFALDLTGYGNYQLPLHKSLIGAVELSTHPEQLPDGMYDAARSVSVLLGVIGCLSLVLIGAQLANRFVGLLAGLLLAINPFFKLLAAQVMLDVPALACSLLAIALALAAKRRLEQGQPPIGLAALSGIALGLAIASKANAGLALIAALLLLVSALVGADQARPRPYRLVLLSALGMLIPSVAVFFLANPPLYTRPILTIQAIVGHSSVAHQSIAPTDNYLATPWQRLVSIFELRGVDVFRVLLTMPGFVIVHAVGLFAFGRRSPRSCGAVLIWGLVTLGGLLLWIPIAWNRYYLPIVPVFALLDALLVGQLAELLRRRSATLWADAALVLLGLLFLSWLLQLNNTVNQTLPGALMLLRVLLVIAVCGAFWQDKIRARPVMVEEFSSAHSLR